MRGAKYLIKMALVPLTEAMTIAQRRLPTRAILEAINRAPGSPVSTPDIIAGLRKALQAQKGVLR